MKSPSSYNLVTQNESIRKILQRVNTIATSEGAVLLVGETGVGKELFAEYIHRTSNRNHKSLIKVSLSSLPSNLIESELFGHVKGAFTGSDHEKKGQFELANKGTIFLDDIDDFPIDLQPKLLRVLESGEITPIGGQKPIPLDIRLITASKIDLSEMVVQGKFRMDLFYRINVFPIVIPPLRDRVDDIPILVEHYLKYYEPQKKIEVVDEALEALSSYNWPGNVRELRNVIQRIALFANGRITLDNLPSEIKGDKPLNMFLKACGRCFKNNNLSYEEIMKCVESHLLENALERSEGNQSKAARALGLSLSTFRDKVKKHNLEK
ncbi:MAG: sigma-54 dependent transcriptional regulator [Bacteroidota bacterium]